MFTMWRCPYIDRPLGAAAAWVDTVEKLGSGRLSVAEILEPAIRLAEEGYVNYTTE